jgi:hypothetical protein
LPFADGIGRKPSQSPAIPDNLANASRYTFTTADARATLKELPFSVESRWFSAGSGPILSQSWSLISGVCLVAATVPILTSRLDLGEREAGNVPLTIEMHDTPFDRDDGDEEA